MQQTLNQAELAKAIGVSVRTISLWRRSGMPYKRDAAGLRYDRGAVRVWLEGEGRKVEL